MLARRCVAPTDICWDGTKWSSHHARRHNWFRDTFFLFFLMPFLEAIYPFASTTDKASTSILPFQGHGATHAVFCTLTRFVNTPSCPSENFDLP